MDMASQECEVKYRFNAHSDYEDTDTLSDIPASGICGGLMEKTSAHGIPNINKANGQLELFHYIY